MKRNTIIVMSESTYIKLKKKIYHNANKRKDPIKYIGIFAKTKIIIDEEVPDGITEVWDEDVYWEFRRESGY